MLFLFCLVLCAASCRSTASVDADDPVRAKHLSGVWVREGDPSAGDVIRIEQSGEGNELIGVLIKVSNHSKMFGYEPGDVKWKFVTINNDGTILIKNLNSTLVREEGTGRVISITKNYGSFLVTVISKTQISLQNQDTTDSKRIGNDQKWRKISG